MGFMSPWDWRGARWGVWGVVKSTLAPAPVDEQQHLSDKRAGRNAGLLQRYMMHNFIATPAS